MESRTIRRVSAFAALVLCSAAAAPVVTQQTGQWALSQGKPGLVSRAVLTPSGDLGVTQYLPGSKVPVTQYQLSEGELMHVILVRDDFGAFSHIHPTLASTAAGTFAIHVSLEPRHRYYAYVSSIVRGLPEQVFRFVLQGRAPAARPTTIAAPVTRAFIGPYVVSLDQKQLRAGRPQRLTADITQSVRAAGIAPYHVAWARAVFINTSSLSYAHVDAVIDQDVCCEYAMRLPALSRGLYRMWLQFSDGTAIYTVPFTLAAR